MDDTLPQAEIDEIAEALNLLNAEIEDVNKVIKNMKSDLAAAAQEAAKAEAVKAELKAIADAEAEYNRLWLQFGHIDDEIKGYVDTIEMMNK